MLDVRRFSKWLVLTVGLVLAANAADAKETLRLKFAKGDTYRYEHTVHMTQNLEIGGQKVEITMEMLQGTVWNVESVDDKGTAKVRLTIDRIRMKMDGAGIQFSFDSKEDKEKKDDKDPLGLKKQFGATFGAMLKVQTHFTINDRGETSKFDVKGLDELKKSLPPGAEKLMPGGTGAESFQQYANLGVVLPKEAVTEGDSWEQPVNAAGLASLGKIKGTSKYTLAKEGKFAGQTCQVIDSASNFEIAIDPKGPLGQFGNAEVKAKPSKGKVFFDDKLGRILGFEQTQDMEMSAMGIKVNMKIEANTKTLPTEKEGTEKKK